MMSELTRPSMVTWQAFEKKPNTWKKSLRLFIAAMLGLGLIYQVESFYLQQRAQALVEQARLVKQSMRANLGYDGSTVNSHHDVLLKLQEAGVKAQSAGFLTSDAAFSDVWVVRVEEKNNPYAVFFLQDSSVKLAEYLATAAERGALAEAGGHCDASQFGADGRLSFCLAL